MMLSDGMVPFLKIEKNFNKSTKTILWLKSQILKEEILFLSFKIMCNSTQLDIFNLPK